jgi:hypothetical protein
MATEKSTAQRPKRAKKPVTQPKGFTPTPIEQLAPLWLEDISSRGIQVLTAITALRLYPFNDREAGGAGLDALGCLVLQLETIANDAVRCYDELGESLRKALSGSKERAQS